MPICRYLQRMQILAESVISPIVSVKNQASQKRRYCKHLCRIDRPSKLVISDISTYTRIVVTSTYLESGDFAYSLNMQLRFFCLLRFLSNGCDCQIR